MWIDLYAVQPDGSAVSRIDACKDLDQRALAGSIFPHQRMNFPTSDDEIHILEGLDAWKALRESTNLKQHFCLVVHG